MPKQQPPIDRELEQVLTRAKTLYPRLLARRAAVAGELETIDAALARLDKLNSTLGSAHSRQDAAATIPRGKSLSPKKLEQPILFALGMFSEPIGSAEILKSLRAKGLVVEPYPLQMALKRLRDEGRVRASGKAKRFTYELGGS